MSVTSLARIAAAFALASIALPASAATITQSFLYAADTDGPIAHHDLRFTFSYDNIAVDPAPTLLAIDYGIGATIFTLANAAIKSQADQGFPGFITLYGLVAGDGFQFVGGVGNNDFRLAFELADIGNTQFAYSTATTAPNFGQAPDDIPLVPIRAFGVPEPATWTMMILGFGMAGGALRRRSAVIPAPRPAAR